MRIPIKIRPCPIVEAIMELRFDAALPDDAVFGVIYNEFSKDYKRFEKLPILQLPETIRSQDPNLIFKPHYKLHKPGYIIQIGPKVISLANIGEYIGWDIFSKQISVTVQKLSEIGIINKIRRFGLRYINLFEGLNIYQNATLKLRLGATELSNEDINLVVALKTGNFTSKLIVVNNAEFHLKLEKKTAKGSLIDIDVAQERDENLSAINEIANDAHIEEKKLFFDILAPEFLETLNPEY